MEALAGRVRAMSSPMGKAISSPMPTLTKVRYACARMRLGMLIGSLSFQCAPSRMYPTRACLSPRPAALPRGGGLRLVTRRLRGPERARDRDLPAHRAILLNGQGRRTGLDQ